MKILHLASVFPNKASGLSFSVPNLIDAQNLESDNQISFFYNTKDGIVIKHIELNQYSIIVLHSFFLLGYLKLLLKLPNSVRVIICPRGAFSKSNKYVLKKHIYSILYFGILKVRSLNYSIHFLTKCEMRRSRFRSANDFVVGNCLAINEIKIKNIDKFLLKKFESKRIVYIGRFSKNIKGLDLLFNWLLNNKKQINKSGFKFEFYGPDTDDKVELINFSKKKGLTFISFFDSVFGVEKERIYHKAMFHILNSRSEGFPMSILESTAFYTPQILSRGTNLQESMRINEFGLVSEELDFNLLNKLDFETYKRMGQNSRSFAEKHDLKAIGKETLIKYS